MQLYSENGIQVTNNLIGFRPDGSTLITGSDRGLDMYGVVDTTVSGNTIGGNTSFGIYASTSDNLVITDNKVGTDTGGTLARGNGTGIQVDSSSQVVIGAPGDGNLVSANTGYGIHLSSSVDSSIKANLVGTDVTGANTLSNGFTSVWLNNSSRIDVGGTAAGEGNVVGGVAPSCCEAGIYLSSADANRILGNRVGVNAVGGALPNAWAGIFLDSGSDANQIGDGTSSGANWSPTAVTPESWCPADAATGSGPTRSTDNGLLGIDLAQDGVTANDSADPDTGSNRLQNFPVLATSGSNAGGTQVTGSLNSRPNRATSWTSFPTAVVTPRATGKARSTWAPRPCPPMARATCPTAPTCPGPLPQLRRSPPQRRTWLWATPRSSPRASPTRAACRRPRWTTSRQQRTPGTWCSR